MMRHCDGCGAPDAKRFVPGFFDYEARGFLANMGFLCDKCFDELESAWQPYGEKLIELRERGKKAKMLL
jgi:hypothetical protein